MNLKRIVYRSWFYFRMGYSLYLSYPVALFGYASSIYYLAVKNIPLLDMIFPHFYNFLIASLIVLPIFGVGMGWMHYKRLLSPFYEAELDIQTEANPYTTEVFTPVNLPSMRILSQLAKQHGIDSSDLDRIIETTEKKFGLKAK